MKNLQFTYTNWKGDEHVYVIAPERTITYEEHGAEDKTWQWQLHGQVVTRDGDPRPEMGPTRRRSFKLAGISEISEVEAGEML